MKIKKTFSRHKKEVKSKKTEIESLRNKLNETLERIKIIIIQYKSKIIELKRYQNKEFEGKELGFECLEKIGNCFSEKVNELEIFEEIKNKEKEVKDLEKKLLET